MPSRMDEQQDDGMKAARRLAESGNYRNWRGVETRLQQLGHVGAEAWFSELIIRGEIDAICSLNFREPI
jgi:hypothetical protein